MRFISGSFDLSTKSGRQQQRYRLALISTAANAFSKAIGILLILLSVNLTVSYLGIERFGIWMLVLSFVTMLSFLDLGVGNALTNHVALRASQDNPRLLCETISGGLAILAFIAILIGFILSIVATIFPWDIFFRGQDPSLVSETKATAITFGILFGVNIFSSGLQRVFAGMQQAYISHIVAVFSTLLACIGLFLSAHHQAGIASLLFSVLGIQAFANLYLLKILFNKKLFSTHKISRCMRMEYRFLYKNAGFFLILQLGTMVGWGADNIIISSVLGVAQVGIFAIVQRLFQFVGQPLALFNTPLWGAYADAEARGDKEFIQKTLKRSLSITFLSAGLLSLCLLIFHQWLIQKWTHGEIVVPSGLVFACAIWAVLEATGNAFAMFLNGTGIIQRQMVVVSIFIVLVLPLKFLLVDYLGLIGIPIATIIIYISINFFFYGFIFLPDITKKLFSEKALT
jgi:O-antigen/teichoic acid export membrane protein